MYICTISIIRFLPFFPFITIKENLIRGVIKTTTNKQDGVNGSQLVWHQAMAGVYSSAHVSLCLIVMMASQRMTEKTDGIELQRIP
jgi:hypothetical protein